MAQESNQTISTASLSTASPPRMTYEEFLAWADEDTWAEWVDGEVIILTSASEWHQNVADFLTALLRFFVEAHNAGIVRSAPFQMKSGPNFPGREPDLLFIAREHLDRLQNTYLNGPADLVVEIVSPESRSRDRGAKFYEYEQAGVREYWLIDPLRRQAEWHQLGSDGVYRPIPIGSDGTLRSVVLEGLWLQVDWLWQTPLPGLLTVLQAWGLV